MFLSFIIACYRSEHTIDQVVDEIFSVAGQRPEIQYEIILVNDCSPDHVLDRLKAMAHVNSNIKVISLAKNVGKASAVLAGMAKSKGEAIVVLDDDGQCPIDRLWELTDKLEEGYDMAIAAYPRKKQTLLKNIGSKVNHYMHRFLLNQPKDIEFSNFNIRRRYICEQMITYKNPYPNLQGLTLQVTHNIAMVPMEERTRIEGKSNYTFLRSVKLLVNGLTTFSAKPLRLASFLGILFSFFGFIMGCYIIIQKILYPPIKAGYSSMMATILLIGGILMILLGIIGEYLGRIYICINNNPQYVIREEYNLDDQNEKELP